MRSVGLFLALVLAGCVGEVPSTTSDTGGPSGLDTGTAQIYRSHRVAEHLNAFRSTCLPPDLTENRVEAAARAAGARVNFGRALQNISQGLEVLFIANSYNRATGRTDPDLVYDSYVCSVRFRGAWADQALVEVRRILAANGFTVTSEFKRESFAPAQAYSGGEALRLKGSVERAGSYYEVALTQSPPGSETTARADIVYISNTLVSIRLVGLE
jgi:hypothetical protein